MSEIQQTNGGQTNAFREESDERLYVLFAERGNQEALAALVSRSRRFAWCAALCLCRNAATAEDAVQEAFLELMRNVSRFQPQGPGSFKAWFHKIVVNRVRTLMRSERRGKQRDLKRGETESMLLREREEQIETSSSESLEVRHVLNKELLELSEELRLPLALHYFEHLTKSEVSRMLNLSPEMVGRRIDKGLLLLRKRLTKAGIAISAVGLPLLLRQTTVLPLPASLIALTPKPLVKVATTRSAPTAYETIRAAGGFSKIAWATLFGVAALMIAGGLWWWKVERPAAAPTSGGEKTLTTKQMAAKAESEKLYRRWTFENGLMDDLKVLDGAWHWSPNKDGKGRMIAYKAPGHGVVLLFPVRTSSSPMMLKIKAVRETSKLYGTGIFFLDEENKTLPSSCFELSDGKDAGWSNETKYVLLDDRILRIRGDNIAELSEYPFSCYGRRFVLALYGGDFTELELRMLEPQECRDYAAVLKRKAAEFQKKGTKPELRQSRRFSTPSVDATWGK
jgi:RNA polymerase sigma-70 factor (ECF subfamily)